MPASVIARMRGEDYAVWPENWPAVDLFLACDTQWRIGMAGPVGLDHNVVFQRMDRMRLHPSTQLRRMEEIGAIERGFIQQLAENRQQHD